VKTYWDTSGLINAAINGSVLARLNAGEHTTRPHTLAEFCGILTGRGIRWERAGQAYELKLTGAQVAAWLQTNTVNFKFLDLPAAEVLAALAAAQKNNVAGPRVHDYLHAVAAQQAGATELLTRNATDFAGLTGPVKVVWP
jgi:predicted nucleic acid-binding protein